MKTTVIIGSLQSDIWTCDLLWIEVLTHSSTVFRYVSISLSL